MLRYDNDGILYLQDSVGKLTDIYGFVIAEDIFITCDTIDEIKAKMRIHAIQMKYQAIPSIMGHPYTEQKHISICELTK